jgi:hypothetical protein
MSTKEPIILSNWFLSDYNYDTTFDDPDHAYPCAIGQVKNHPKLKDGEWIKTAIFVRYDAETGEFVTEKNHHYVLIEADSLFLDCYPTVVHDLIAILSTKAKKK